MTDLEIIAELKAELNNQILINADLNKIIADLKAIKICTCPIKNNY